MTGHQAPSGDGPDGRPTGPRAIYRRDSALSSVASFMSDVEMAQDEVFAGPMSESVPTSIASFQHRRSRTDSITSFTYFQEDDENPEYDDEAVIEEDEEAEEDQDDDEHDSSAFDDEEDLDLESGDGSSLRRKSSERSRASSDQPLLARPKLHPRISSRHHRESRSVQKMYIENEDLTIVLAGFSTNLFGFAVYLTICIITGGLGYLVFRWMPRWRVKLIGRPTPLRRSSWLVIENQWGELSIHNVLTQPYDQPLSTVFGLPEKESARPFYEDDDPIMGKLRFLDYRYMRLCFHPIQDQFVLITSWKDPAWTNVKTLREGLDNDERDLREQVFGENIIEIQKKSIPQLLVDEAFHPFYIFQVASLVLWSLDEYYYYAACIFVISVFSITTTVVETRSTMARLREISKFECDVRVLRNGFWRSVPSRELVAGDVYEVSDPSLTQLPCDSLLLAGDCIINESMLTGESVPVSKIPLVDEALELLDLGATSIHPSVARHFLFCGTKIIRARRPQDEDDDEAVALAITVRTGFNTTKGALVRSMLFPKPSGFKFYRDSFRYISVMGGIAICGFIASFVNFVRLGLAWHLIVVRALDLITIVVPPALPATLTIGTNFALSRLKQKQIFCISPQRVNVGGKLDVVCFDKTGTLTEDGLDVLGVRVVNRHDMRFTELLPDADTILPGAAYDRDPTIEYGIHKAILWTMATCHSLRSVDGELIGDPLDLKMFEFTNWSFEEGHQGSGNVENEENNSLSPSVARPPPGMEFDIDDETPDDQKKPVELGVLRAFDFVSHLRRASVIVRQFGATNGHVFVKGAPESLKEICTPESLPVDFDDLLGFYTHRGFRVIACATKEIPRLNWMRVQKMSRTDAESDLQFVGFIIFENKLKDTTAEVISELHDANIRQIMCTGDNILTAVSVARECGLVEKSSHCYIPHFVEGDSMDPKARLVWESVDNHMYQLDEYTLMPLPVNGNDISVPSNNVNQQKYSVAVSGDVFRWIIDYGSEETLKRMLVCGEVFARMSPDEKHELVEKLQSIDYCCGFCGDGANDCGALKAADVGISLSEAEASVAAPFTSRVFDISCVPKLIREGRAALVTSFCCFKFMSLYSAIQFTSVSFLYATASNLGDFQFLFIDIALILPIAIFMGWTGAFPVLAKKRPTANLVSRKVLTPLIGQIVLCVLTQLIAYKAVQGQPWFVPPELDPDKSNIVNSENTALFLVSCYQYVLSGVVLSVGPPYRRSMTSNVPFVVTIVVALLISSYMLLDPAEWLFNFMELTEMSLGFKFKLLLLAAVSFGIAWTSERYVLPGMARLFGQISKRVKAGAQKKRKEYKVLLKEMGR